VNQLRLEIPPFKILSLSTKTLPTNNGNELFCIACSFKDSYHIEDHKGLNKINQYQPLIFMRKMDSKLPIYNTRLENKAQSPPSFDLDTMRKKFGEGNAFMANTEFALLSQFLGKVASYDPDVIIGHNLYNQHIDIITNRINKLKVSGWSKIGRFKREVFPKFLQSSNMSNEYIRNCVSGRLLCDTFISTREILLRETNYDLRYLCEKYLNVNIPEIDAGNLLGTFTSLDEIVHLLEVTLNEAVYSMMLMNKYNF
jgi:DNA polymerase elongation subunit (family B)